MNQLVIIDVLRLNILFFIVDPCFPLPTEVCSKKCRNIRKQTMDFRLAGLAAQPPAPGLPARCVPKRRSEAGRFVPLVWIAVVSLFLHQNMVFRGCLFRKCWMVCYCSLIFVRGRFIEESSVFIPSNTVLGCFAFNQEAQVAFILSNPCGCCLLNTNPDPQT